MAGPTTTRCRAGFTLIELLITIGVISILMMTLLPILTHARHIARSGKSLSNLRQIGIGSAAYNAERNDWFCYMSSDPASQLSAAGGSHKPRWVDYLYTYLSAEDVFLSPNIEADEYERMNKVFWHAVSSMPAEQAGRPGANLAGAPLADVIDDEPARHGGYGWNYQYLGNSRRGGTFANGFNARLGLHVRTPSETILAGDTGGSRGGNAGNLPGAGGNAVYVLDPPAGSSTLGSRGGHPNGSRVYYAAGAMEVDIGQPVKQSEDYLVRSAPVERNRGAANMAFVDGHAAAMMLTDIDDSDGDGLVDHGLWNGLGRRDAWKR